MSCAFLLFDHLIQRFDAMNASLTQLSGAKKKGWQRASPSLNTTGFVGPASLDPMLARYFAPAAAAIVGAVDAPPTVTLICFGLVSSRFGRLKVKTPF